MNDPKTKKAAGKTHAAPAQDPSGCKPDLTQPRARALEGYSPDWRPGIGLTHSKKPIIDLF